MEKNIVDEVLISMILIQDSGISINTKRNHVGRISNILGICDLDVKYGEVFEDNSMAFIRNKRYTEWKNFLKQVLIFLEQYEAIAQLRLNINLKLKQ